MESRSDELRLPNAAGVAIVRTVPLVGRLVLTGARRSAFEPLKEKKKKERSQKDIIKRVLKKNIKEKTKKQREKRQEKKNKE
jgi:hypothetical protein